uniref:Uncharacterized protein n=1 Tax=Anguilla anguilla TaxID=7936 RepID=A0A0E9S3N3_ANGAN
MGKMMRLNEVRCSRMQLLFISLFRTALALNVGARLERVSI